jgi:hypothetical protein
MCGWVAGQWVWSVSGMKRGLYIHWKATGLWLIHEGVPDTVSQQQNCLSTWVCHFWQWQAALQSHRCPWAAGHSQVCVSWFGTMKVALTCRSLVVVQSSGVEAVNGGGGSC